MHFPDSAVDTAKVTPAETVGPYAFVQYESLWLLGDIALNIVKYLEQRGYNASITYDLGELSSCVKSSRGMLPDLQSNRFAAVLAGLGYIGSNGIPLTSKFGPRQRFIAIVTDYSFKDDPLYSEKIVCEKCDKTCINSCPTNAIAGKNLSFSVDGKTFNLPKIDQLKCDWAKRYGLVSKDGPEYYAVKTDVPYPKNITPEKLAKAISKIKWGVQKRHINICEECLRTCTFKGNK